MDFIEFETLMFSRGITSLAEIARRLDTTPQAVSNWKSRNQIPLHIIAKLNQMNSKSQSNQDRFVPILQDQNFFLKDKILVDDNIAFSDIALTLAQNLKVIFLCLFIFGFSALTYVQFILAPLYVSTSTILLPDNKTTNLGGFAGLASQFGVNVPTVEQADLSSPSLFPEILKSRTFAEKILEKKFFTEKFGDELTLLSILTHGNNISNEGDDELFASAFSSLSQIIEFKRNSLNAFSELKITTIEPQLSKDLNEAILSELEATNKFFRSQTVNEKISFINQRIAFVEKDLKKSEQALKAFNEQNRQISSPALRLEQERFERDAEIQKGIFLTLKQQLELARIEEVQKSSIVQILDRPQAPLFPSNKNVKLSTSLSMLLGLIVGLAIAFVRSFFEKNDLEERRKFRKTKHYIQSKSFEVITDFRISGIVTLFLILGLPFYLSYESKNPVFFGKYSQKLFLILTSYIVLLLISSSLFLINIIKKKNK